MMKSPDCIAMPAPDGSKAFSVSMSRVPSRLTRFSCTEVASAEGDNPPANEMTCSSVRSPLIS